MLITVLALTGCILVVGIFLTIFALPDLYVRLWKSLVRSIRHAVGLPTLTAEQEEAKAMAIRLAPYQNIVNKIEEMIPGEILRYKIPATWGGSFIAIQRNSQYPQRGRRYILSIEDGIGGIPGGQNTVMYDSDEPLILASSIIDRSGELFTGSGEKSISAEKTTISA
jgi:hypothetical protein